MLPKLRVGLTNSCDAGPTLLPREDATLLLHCGQLLTPLFAALIAHGEDIAEFDGADDQLVRELARSPASSGSAFQSSGFERNSRLGAAGSSDSVASAGSAASSQTSASSSGGAGFGSSSSLATSSSGSSTRSSRCASSAELKRPESSATGSQTENAVAAAAVPPRAGAFRKSRSAHAIAKRSVRLSLDVSEPTSAAADLESGPLVDVPLTSPKALAQSPSAAASPRSQLRRVRSAGSAALVRSASSEGNGSSGGGSGSSDQPLALPAGVSQLLSLFGYDEEPQQPQKPKRQAGKVVVGSFETAARAPTRREISQRALEQLREAGFGVPVPKQRTKEEDSAAEADEVALPIAGVGSVQTGGAGVAAGRSSFLSRFF